ncbi:helix-turn-helix transcriptional regulator [Streptomyces sp. TRM68416]|uniref:helix-turn-helix transcriptional regulator n=1 Tax=Streptomyces sp. TRM68416 TaxID=2758412 RepID=UPI001661AFF9|nr:response regulator transcription factor [Streptomyces sp. TRM68416]MBD0842371.1 response regulator transcription factor [Streptomyces sp. TRM68416]
MHSVRTAVRAALEETQRFGVVAEGAPGTVTDIVRWSRPDVLVISHAAESEALHTLLRLHGPDAGGQRRPEPAGRRRTPASVVLADRLTGHGTRHLLRHGAAGILRRATAAVHLPWAVAAVAQGSLALDPCLTEPVKNAYVRPVHPHQERAPAEALVSALTPRERDVLALVGDGLPNREIASALNLSTDTVKDHLRRIYTKLGADTRLHAARIAWQAGVGTTRLTEMQVAEWV